MKILSLNCGSSSLRWGLFDVREQSEIAAGKVEEAPNASAAWEQVRDELHSLTPDAIGHRVVHGGEHFTDATLIDEAVIASIEEQIPLAPGHNPGCLYGIHEARRLYPDRPHVAVFDTAFHQSLPPEAFLYGLPYEFYERDRIRRYGFHGTSHRFASERAADCLGIATNEFTGITCHLGNGCSVAAIKHGRSVDTSMGMTPLEGLMMGTRSGDVDPAVVLRLVSQLGDVDKVADVLNRESGLIGVSGISSDLREIEEAATRGVERAKLALEIFGLAVRREIGSAMGVLGEASAVVFTGGIGENAAVMRARILEPLAGIGMLLDAAANRDCVGREGLISTPESRVALFVFPAREEWLIARETEAALRGANRGSQAEN